jgi:CrcB protein
MFSRLLIVCLGGAAGSGARFLLSTAIARAAGQGFPWWTWTVNVLGCFALEVVLGLAAGALRISPHVQLLLTTGFMGGFTTYSSYNTEVLALFRAGQWRLGSAYVAATLAGCLVAGALGAALARRA